MSPAVEGAGGGGVRLHPGKSVVDQPSHSPLLLISLRLILHVHLFLTRSFNVCSRAGRDELHVCVINILFYISPCTHRTRRLHPCSSCGLTPLPLNIITHSLQNNQSANEACYTATAAKLYKLYWGKETTLHASLPTPCRISQLQSASDGFLPMQ